MRLQSFGNGCTDTYVSASGRSRCIVAPWACVRTAWVQCRERPAPSKECGCDEGERRLHCGSAGQGKAWRHTGGACQRRSQVLNRCSVGAPGVRCQGRGLYAWSGARLGRQPCVEARWCVAKKHRPKAALFQRGDFQCGLFFGGEHVLQMNTP